MYLYALELMTAAMVICTITVLVAVGYFINMLRKERRERTNPDGKEKGKD